MAKQKQHKEQISFPKDLNSNDILIAEYQYAAQSAFQANEDRVKVFNFVFANILTLGASFIAPFLNISFDSKLFGYLFIALAAIGFLSIIQLVKLRRAWRESVKAMNKVKEYYIQANPQLESAFKWRAQTIPTAAKVFSMSFLMVFMLMILNTLAIITAITLLTPPSRMLYHLVIAGFLIITQFIVWVFASRD